MAACAPAAAPAPSEPAWSYEVRVTPGLDLEILATIAAGEGPLRVEEDAARFVEGLGPCAPPCRARYRVRLAEAARALHDVDVAWAAQGVVVAPPSTWLAHPNPPARGALRFHVTAPDGVTFVTGVRPSAQDTYEADVHALDEASFAGFGAWRVVRASPETTVAIAPGLRAPDEAIAGWIGAEVRAIGGYLGRPPDDRVVVFAAPGTQEVTRGKTFGDGGASILVRVGTGVLPDKLLDDWVVAHELVHVGFPRLDRTHTWFAEGLATYVEPIARARAGLVTKEKVWEDLLEGLPRGAAGEGGLDGAEEIDRVYWGGALFFLLADLEIRQSTRGTRSLDDAIRAVRATVEARWPLERVLDVGDLATGTRVLHGLYRRLGQTRTDVDLPTLFARIGVKKEGTKVVFDPRAPLAKEREAITAVLPRRDLG